MLGRKRPGSRVNSLQPVGPLLTRSLLPLEEMVPFLLVWLLALVLALVLVLLFVLMSVSEEQSTGGPRIESKAGKSRSFSELI